MAVADIFDLDTLAADCAEQSLEIGGEVWDAQSPTANHLQKTVLEFGDSLIRLKQAKQRAAAALNNPMISELAAQQQSVPLVTEALAAAHAALESATAALDAAPDAIFAGLLPQMPSRPDAHGMMSFKAAELSKTLEMIADPAPAKAQALAAMFGQALAAGDETMSYLLASPLSSPFAGGNTPMSLSYARAGLDPSLMRTLFAVEIERCDPTRRGVKLYKRLSTPQNKLPKGTKTLRSLVVAGASALMQQDQGYGEWQQALHARRIQAVR